MTRFSATERVESVMIGWRYALWDGSSSLGLDGLPRVRDDAMLSAEANETLA
jgi:hypothetical protein